MPTYEYECQKCKRRREVFQSITAKPLTTCPTCRGRLKRLLGSGSGFLFKGTGFYITDYRSKSYHDAKKRDQPPTPPAPGDSGRAGKSDSSPTTKSSADKPACRAEPQR